MTLAVIILAFNEEKDIAGAVESARQVTDEVIVIDSGSSDRTVEIAEERGARVVFRSWDDDFSAQRNFASDKTSAHWLLHLDADERIDEELAGSVKKTVSDGLECIYSFRRFNIAFGRNFKYGPLRPSRIRRLYPRGKAVWSGKVHEGLFGELPQKTLAGALIHYTYDSWEECNRKFESYTSLWAEGAFDKGKRVTLVGALMHAAVAFVQSALLHGGVLDGADGVRMCWHHARFTLTKYMKLRRIQRPGAVRAGCSGGKEDA
jgi:hypothetical protein